MRRHADLAFLADIVLVIVFVLIGRASHDENPVGGALETLWPFAIGLAIGWLGARAWRTPTHIVPTGLIIWGLTVVVGMLLRVVSQQGVEVSFVIVAAVVLGVFLLGWRLVAALVGRRRAR